jgi:hypothetical protein
VSGYSGRSYKTFEKHKAAEKWLKANLVSFGGLVKRCFERLVCLTQARTADRSVEARSSTTEQDLCLPISVSTSDLLVQLCPDGVSVEMQEELAAVTIDAYFLPGTYAPSERPFRPCNYLGVTRRLL